MLNVALVGFGLSGRYLQAPFLAANPNFNLAIIVTSNEQLATALYPHAKVVASIEEALTDDIDLVSIASPSYTHFAYAQQALLAKKHVLIEKPMASSAAEAEALVTLAKEQGKLLSVFQNRRFDSDFLTLKKVIEGQLLGDIVSYEARYDRFKPILNTKKWKEEANPANGIIYDLGPHILDQALLLFGLPDDYWGKTYRQRAGSVIDDAFDIFLSYPTFHVKLSSSLLVKEESPRYQIHGTKGSFVKYGIDMQEDHLKAGLLPGMEGFGKEPTSQAAWLNTEIAGVSIKGHIETETGDWGKLFQNIYEAIAEGKPLAVEPSLVVEQIRIIESICEKKAKY